MHRSHQQTRGMHARQLLQRRHLRMAMSLWTINEVVPVAARDELQGTVSYGLELYTSTDCLHCSEACGPDLKTPGRKACINAKKRDFLEMQQDLKQRELDMDNVE
jgi:hypothetical protein